MNNTRFGQFLMDIQDYFMQNGYIYPNSIDYNDWVDSGPMVGDVYPKLQKIIEWSDKELVILNK